MSGINLEAERALLGACLLDEDAYWRVADQIRSEYFSYDSHGCIWDAAVALANRDEQPDLVTVTRELDAQGKSERAGGVVEVAALLDAIPDTANVESYARIVRECWMSRKLAALGKELTHRADLEENPEQVVATITEKLANLCSVQAAALVHAGIPAAAEVEKIIDMSKGNIHRTTIPTGLVELDRLLGGLEPGELTLIAARPGVGKTALALTLMSHIAVDLKEPTAFFSLEMTAESCMQRMLAIIGDVPLRNIRDALLSKDHEERLHSAGKMIADSKLWIDDEPALTPQQVHARCQRLRAVHNLRLVIVDYAQLLTNPKAESRREEVSKSARALKAMAKQLHVPVIALAQLNRMAEGETPRVSHLGESDDLGREADSVIFIQRAVGSEIARLLIGKQRQGATGEAEIIYEGRYTRFKGKAEENVW